MEKTPVHAREEYVEQAYFFRTCRERQSEGRALQDVLDQLHEEILSTTRLPFAIQFMVAELKHSGLLSAACDRLPHYFTPFQAFVLAQSENDTNRLTFEQATTILEREATYRATDPTPAGLFVFQIEALSRNRLGYLEGLRRMAMDGAFDDDWCEYFDVVRSQLGVRELPELVFVRSESFVREKQREDPDYEPTGAILFGEKEGRIARANIGRDPEYFFAALQRQLGYPQVPRPPKQDSLLARLDRMGRQIQRLEEKLRVVEQEVRGGVDLSPFMVGKDGKAPIDERLARDDETKP
jgi:hypothetical protein